MAIPINVGTPGGYRYAPPTLQKWQRPGNGDNRKGHAVACPGLTYNRSAIRSKAEICGMAESSQKRTSIEHIQAICTNMGVEQIIREAFPDTAQQNVNDNYISEHQNLMEIRDEIDLLLYVPMYMLWCVRNADNYSQSVTLWTINSIAEYGRAKNQANSYLNFKFRCNLEQKKAVLAFLRWCRTNIDFVHEEQIARATKHWEAALD